MERTNDDPRARDMTRTAIRYAQRGTYQRSHGVHAFASKEDPKRRTRSGWLRSGSGKPAVRSRGPTCEAPTAIDQAQKVLCRGSHARGLRTAPGCSWHPLRRPATRAAAKPLVHLRTVNRRLSQVNATHGPQPVNVVLCGMPQRVRAAKRVRTVRVHPCVRAYGALHRIESKRRRGNLRMLVL